MRRLALGSCVLLVACERSPSKTPTSLQPHVRVWQDTLVLPTWEEGAPDRNAPFDVLGPKRVNYPYTLRRDFADHPTPHAWRALHLENEFLHCIVLPDLGGHLYGCTDKRTGAEMFYANKSIKLANVAYRGAWAAFGIEFNFPVSHSWVTVSPVDFATAIHADGSASIWVGNIDRVTGMAWRVELVLRPRETVLDQRTTIENPSDTRHRFYWWTNAAVRATDETEILYPMELTASHGFTEIDTWPVTTKGRDLHIVGNHKEGPVSLFSHASREPYMAVLEPKTQIGVAHVSSPTDLPAKKFYSWGVDGDARAWNRTLSDDESNYVEVQAGLFRNQETYGFLEPQTSISFVEHWLPLRDLASVSRVNENAALHLARAVEQDTVTLALGLGVTRAVPDASITLRDGPRVIAQTRASLSPATTHTQRWPRLAPGAKYTVEIVDAQGALVIRHTEGVYDVTPRSEIAIGPQPVVDPGNDLLAAGTAKELDGRLIEALAIYERGLRTTPHDASLLRAAGRLALSLKQNVRAVGWLDEVTRQTPADYEASYYLGHAQLAPGQLREARSAFEAALPGSAQRAPALLGLAAIAGRERDHARSLALLERAIGERPPLSSTGALEVALLRALGKTYEAKARLVSWLGRDPTSSALRYEATRLGRDDDALFEHLAGDPERILALAGERMHFGLWADAVDLLARTYPTGVGVFGEPGMPAVAQHPLIAYYRGFAREELGQDATADYAQGAQTSTDLVFPNRADTIPVLERVLAKNQNDATAHMLLGAVLLSGGMVTPAIEEWEKVQKLDPKRRGLHRNLGLTLLRTGGSIERAQKLLEEGTTVDPDNTEIWTGLDECLAKLKQGPEARLAVLAKHPRANALPPVLVLQRALLLAEAGRFDDAEHSLAGRTFDREERGLDVRGVYLQLRVARAEARAKAKDCKGARAVIEHLTDAVPGLSFTDSALGAYASAPAIKTRVDAMKRACP